MIWLLVLACVSWVDSSSEECVEEILPEESCVLYNVTSLNCTWKAGIDPPEEYSFFLNFNQTEEECPCYIKDGHGNRTCHIPYANVSESEITVTLKKLVNQSLVLFCTKNLILHKGEILNPPQNITVICNEGASNCTVQWTRPPNIRNVNLENCFEYDIQDETGNIVTVIQDTNKVYPADKKHTLRIRARGTICPVSTRDGEWSAPIVVGSDSNPYDFPIISLTFVIIGTVLTILILFLLCKRFSIWQKLTDPIPQPNLILDPDENMEKTWVDLKHTADEKITMVEEMTNSCKKP